MDLQSDLIHEVNKIGVNINQITKMFHTGYFQPEEIKELLKFNELRRKFKTYAYHITFGGEKAVRKELFWKYGI